jgi:oligoendopeptidase F
MVKNKFLARLLAGLLTVSTVFMSAPSYVLADGDDDELTDDLESKVEHTDKKFDELEIEDLSEDEFDSIIKDIDDLCQDEANSDEVIEIITEMEKYLSRISANGSLSYIYTTLDADDESADEEYQKWDELYTNCADKVMITYHTVAESACSDALKEKIDDDDDWQDILDYVPMTDEQKEMQKKDTELSLKYDEIADKEYTYEINGEEYDMDMLEEVYTNGDISFDEYLDALADIMTRQNEEKGELYIELVELRTEFAKSYGYDNYADYCYDKVYDRDYTHDDLKAFDDQVKEYYSPLLSDLYNEFSDRRDEFDALSDQDMSYDECCRLLSEHFSDISDDLYESYNYMVDHDLCNMEIDDKKAEGGYTTDIAGIYNSVYIFNDADGSVQDLATLIHEFGHYNQKYFASEEEWEYGLSNLDLAEIHSQGLEAIYDKYADELYGDSADIMRIYNALNQVYGAVEGCKEDEFQYRIYSDPYDLTVSKINQVYYECCEEYGDLYLTNTYYLALYGKTPSCEIYEWADIHHTFKSPCYYISYAVSMGAVDELKNVLDRDFSPQAPNAVWCTDITYIHTDKGFVYLSCIMELYSRRILAWQLAPTLETKYVIDAVHKAITATGARPKVIHTDRGTQYTSVSYWDETQGIIKSYSSKANPWDNACIESFHALIKREWLNRFKIRDIHHAHSLVFEYIDAFYNTRRIHSYCGYRSPIAYENLYYMRHSASLGIAA